MREYYLEQNLFFNCTHVHKVRWHHRLFGMPSLTIATCQASSKELAERRFVMMDYQVGVGF